MKKAFIVFLTIISMIWSVVGHIVADYATSPSFGDFCEYSAYVTLIAVFVGWYYLWKTQNRRK